MLFKHETISGRRQTLYGQTFERGDIVPESVLMVIPPNRRSSMERLSLLLKQETPVTEEVVPELVEPEGMCPQCGEGPFSRLARHITAKHEELESVNGVS